MSLDSTVMAMATDSAAKFLARGKVTAKRGVGGIVFKPTGTTYELFLEGVGYDGPIDIPVELMITLQARKLWTVPTGGNFIEPIFGKPRTIQGRVKAIVGQTLVVQAGIPLHVQLPASDSAVDLNNGAVTVGHLVNVMVMPGASYRWETPISKAV